MKSVEKASDEKDSKDSAPKKFALGNPAQYLLQRKLLKTNQVMIHKTGRPSQVLDPEKPAHRTSFLVTTILLLIAATTNTSLSTCSTRMMAPISL